MTKKSFKDLETCITALSILPLEEMLPVVLESQAELAQWKGMRFAYRAKAAWLRVLMLMEPLPSALLETDMKFLLPHAEMSKALADLVAAVYVRAGDSPIVMASNSPAELWLACEVSSCLIQFDTGGLTDSPALIGKQDLLIRSTQALDWLGALADGMNVAPPAKIFLPLSRHSLTRELEAVALELAQNCSQFNHRHYRPYLKAIRHGLSQIKRCQDLQVSYYVAKNDQLFVTGKDKKLPPRM